MNNKVYYKSAYLYASIFFGDELAVCFVEDEQKRNDLLNLFKEFKENSDIIKCKVDHVYQTITINEELAEKHLNKYLKYFVKE